MKIDWKSNNFDYKWIILFFSSIELCFLNIKENYIRIYSHFWAFEIWNALNLMNILLFYITVFSCPEGLTSQ